MQRFTFRHKATGGVSLEMPPEVPAGWEVTWSTEQACFQFVNPKLQVCTWGAPSVGDESWVEAWDMRNGRVCYVCGDARSYLSPSLVPLPWKMVLDAERARPCFFNSVSGKYSCDADGMPVIPVDMVQDDNGDWYFEDATDGTVAYVSMAEPSGWDLCWDVSEQSFYWRCQTTGTVTYDEPHCPDDDSDAMSDFEEGDLDMLVIELQEVGLLSEGDDISEEVVRSCRMKFFCF